LGFNLKQMSTNIKNLLSSEWWRELKQELDNRADQLKEEILTEAASEIPDLRLLRKKSADREAILELKGLPAALISSAEVMWEF